MEFTPRPYQDLIERFILTHGRGNVFAGMGMGKSAATIGAYSKLRFFGEAHRLLVVAPRRVALMTWPGEIEKWRESFGHLTIAAAVGTPEQRIAAVRSNADITCINYENLPWLCDGYGDQWPYDMVVPDESTRLKNMRMGLRVSKTGLEYVQGQGGKRARALAKIAHSKVRRWINLTGSPAPNGIVDLWGQQWFVDGGTALGRSFKEFESRFFNSYRTPDGFVDYQPKATAQRDIEQLLIPHSIALQAKDWFPLRDVIERHVEIEMPDVVRKAYREMEKEFFAEIRAMGVDRFLQVEAMNGGARSMKLRQFASGIAFHAEGIDEVHDEKLQALESVLEEATGESVLIRYEFVPDRDRILKRFGRGRKPVRLLHSQKDLDAWDSGQCHLLCHAASAGHGLSLQDGGRILCDYGFGWSLEEDEQIIERIGPTRQYQSGHDRVVFRYRIVARDTIETKILLPRLTEKMSVQDAFKNALRAA